jgi:drug/metabolite transporter (DMT)-like permease
VPPRDLAALAGLAALGIAANQLLFIAGLARTSATMAVVLGTTIPVFTAGLAIALRREPARAAAVAGVAVGFAGALVTVGGARGADADLLGGALIVLNSLAYALYLVLGRPVVQRHDPLVVITWVVTFGAVMVVPFGAADAIAAAPHLSTTAWAAIGWIVLAATVGTYTLNAWALARAPATLVATYIYVQPPVGALLAAILLGERPEWTTAAGALLIAGGIWIVSYTARSASSRR